jgi:hypothetical protein
MKTTKQMKVQATEYETAREAIANADAETAAVLLNGKIATIARADAERLAAAGASFAYLACHEGKVVTIPVN